MKTFISFSSFSDELQKLASEEKIPLPKADNKIFNLLLKGSPVKIKITPDADNYGGGYFDQLNKEIGISEKNYETLAHEIGHAEIDKHILGRILQSRIARLASNPVPNTLVGIGAGLLMAKGKKWGLFLPAALAAPTIISELLASHKGNKKLEEVGATKEQLDRYKKDMRKALSTYLISPTLGTLTAIAR